MCRWLPLLALALALPGCPRVVPSAATAPSTTTPGPDAGVVDAEQLGARVDALEREVAQVVRAQDEALWRHWTQGAPLDLSAATKGHDALFTRATLDLLRRAAERRPGDQPRLSNLQHWLAGELLARGVAAESEALANLEASATFLLDGKEVAWRELGRVLATEKSAVKRRAVWAASHAAALRLDAALARRDQRAREVLAELDLPGALDLAASARELDLAVLAKSAQALLDETDAEWKVTLQGLAAANVKLPVAGLTRADLPRLLQPPAAVDAEFPKAKVAERVVQTLGALGVYGRAGLTLELTDSSRKNPLPLTVATGPQQVRVSARPAGGLLDQQQVLAELGVALALHAAKTGSFATERLGDPARALRAGQLLARLAEDPEWLAFTGVKEPTRAQVAATARAHQLFALRRAAGAVLSRLEAAAGQDEGASRGRYVALMARATGVPVALEEGARWRLETDDFLRSASLIKAAGWAEGWLERAGPGWWQKPELVRELLSTLERGTAAH